MDILKQKFKEKSGSIRKEVKEILKKEGARKVDEVTLSQMFGGMRGVKSMVWETSNLDAEQGIRTPVAQVVIPALEADGAEVRDHH